MELWPLLVVIAVFLFIWVALFRLIKNSRRRRVISFILSAVGVLVLGAAFQVQSNRQHRNLLVLRSLEWAQPLRIHQNWHAVHFLLTGDAWGGKKPLFNVVLGGHQIGQRGDYGGLRYLTSQEVQEVADALTPLTKDVLQHRFTPEELTKADIYCWKADQGQKGIDASLEVYEKIPRYFKDAANKGNAMLIFRK